MIGQAFAGSLRVKHLLTPCDLCEHLLELLLDDRVVGGACATVQPEKSRLGFVKSALLGEPSRRVWKGEHSASIVSNHTAASLGRW
jgi:hypothetical protein